jgi:long-chain acyl-CoA synthetase
LVPGYLSALGRRDAFRDGWFYPGDLATIDDDGSFVLAGRSSEVANLGGVKVDPALVDEAAEQVAGVVEAALVIVDALGGADAVLAVVCADDATALAALDAARGAAFGMRLETAWRVDALPRTEQGKLRRAELARRFRARAR